MAATPLMKAVLLMVSINILLYVAGVRVISDDNTNLMGQLIEIDNITGELSNDNIVVKDTLREGLPASLEETGANVLNFIDSVGAIKDFIFFVINIVFTPLGLFIGAGMPQAITMMIGIPIMMVLFLGVAYFIRSGN